MDIKRIKELDCLAHAKKTKIEELERQINEIKQEYASIYEMEAELKAKIKKLEEEIENIKIELDILYNQEQEPIPGALHYFKKVQQFEVVDLSRVPLGYKTVDMKSVRQAYAAGIKVPGIVVINKRIIVLK